MGNVTGRATGRDIPGSKLARLVAFAAILTTIGATRTFAGIDASQVLVVYNSAASGAEEVLHAYIAAHPDLPPENLLDLNNPAIAGADMSYNDFATLVRSPIRSYILAPGAPSAQDIVAILLLRPFPHRIQDNDGGGVCDSPSLLGGELVNGDATCASLDAELVMLWQNTSLGENGGQMDSLLDNMIVNPYHTSATPISAFSRAQIQIQHTFTNLGDVVWDNSTAPNRLTPGDMYLVCRIDGNSTEDCVALIQRSQRLLANKATATMLFDEFNLIAGTDLDDDGLFTMNDPFLAGDDYEETTALLTNAGWNVIYDGTFDFIEGMDVPEPLIGYASYGENHAFGGAGENPPGEATFIDFFNFAPGAVFNTIESFNGRALNGLPISFVQEQVADFVAAGGTFAIGNVWEPLSFSVADNEFILPRMLDDNESTRFTWGEAAYASLPALSWMQIVIGDPLSKFDVVDDVVLLPGDLDDNGAINGVDADLFALLLLGGYDDYRAMFPALDPFARADFSMDYQFDGHDLQGFIDAYINQ